MQIKKMKVEDLKPADYNPRKKLKPGDKEFEKLKKSIEEFGYVEPIILNERTNTVVGGHQRLEVMKHLGYSQCCTQQNKWRMGHRSTDRLIERVG